MMAPYICLFALFESNGLSDVESAFEFARKFGEKHRNKDTSYESKLHVNDNYLSD